VVFAARNGSPSPVKQVKDKQQLSLSTNLINFNTAKVKTQGYPYYMIKS